MDAAQSLLADFEAGTLPQLTHADHVRLAFEYLRRWELTVAYSKLATGLAHFAAARGAPEKFDSELTRSWTLRIHERVQTCPDLSWAEFAERNSDLFEPERVLAPPNKGNESPGRRSPLAWPEESSDAEEDVPESVRPRRP